MVQSTLRFDIEPWVHAIDLDTGSWVMGEIKRSGLIEAIDKELPKTSNNKNLTHGQVISLLMTKLATSAPSPLSSLPSYASKIPMAAWLEDDGLDPTMFNRFVVCECFDAVMEYGPSRFYSFCASALLRNYDLSTVDSCNFDSSSFHWHGRCLVFDPMSDPMVLKRIEEGDQMMPEDQTELVVTFGYSRDNRPQDRQINMMMATVWVPGTAMPMPICAYPFSGSKNDIAQFPEFIATAAPRIKEACPNMRHLVCDSAGATYKSVRACLDAGLHLITRLPDSTTSARLALNKAAEGQVQWQELVSKGDDGQEDKVIVKVAEVGIHVFKGRKKKGEADIAGKMLLVNAESMRGKKTETINHKADKEQKKATAEINAIAAACLPDAQREVNKIVKGLKFCTLSQVEFYEAKRYKQRGRPKKGATPTDTDFRVKAVVERNEEAIQSAIEQELLYVLWTSDADVSPLMMYCKYHQQADVEGCWKGLKDPSRFANTFFVKTAKHIAAYAILMSLALLAQRLAMNSIRKLVEDHKLAMPRLSHSNPTLTPAWETIKALFGLAGLQFNTGSKTVVASGYAAQVIELIRQAPHEVSKLFDSEYLGQYVDAITKGSTKFLIWVAKLAKQAPASCKSLIKRHEEWMLQKNQS